MFFAHWEYNLGNLYSQPKWKGLLDYGSNQFHVFNFFPQIEYKVRDNLSRLVSRLQSKFFFLGYIDNIFAPSIYFFKFSR